MSRPLVIYHGNCADGFTAAWAAWKKFGDDADYHAGVYQNPPPDCKGRDVVMVDFSHKHAVLSEIAAKCKSLLILDHHKTAADDVLGAKDDSPAPLIVEDVSKWSGDLTWQRMLESSAIVKNEGVQRHLHALFDMNRSGARIAWDFFHPGKPVPYLVQVVEDRDLWRFALPNTREIQAAIFSYEYTWENWEKLNGLCNLERKVLIDQGEAIERKHHKDIRELVAVCKRRMVIGGVEVWAASLPYTLTSDAGHLMCEGGEPFAACYWDTLDGRVFSLRSRDDGADVAEIAKKYGGGGHKHASGFRLPHGVAP